MRRRTATKSIANAVAAPVVAASGGVFIAATVVTLVAVSIYQELISVMQYTHTLSLSMCVACLNCGQSPPDLILFCQVIVKNVCCCFSPLFSHIFLKHEREEEEAEGKETGRNRSLDH